MHSIFFAHCTEYIKRFTNTSAFTLKHKLNKYCSLKGHNTPAFVSFSLLPYATEVCYTVLLSVRERERERERVGVTGACVLCVCDGRGCAVCVMGECVLLCV